MDKQLQLNISQRNSPNNLVDDNNKKFKTRVASFSTKISQVNQTNLNEGRKGWFDVLGNVGYLSNTE